MTGSSKSPPSSSSLAPCSWHQVGVFWSAYSHRGYREAFELSPAKIYQLSMERNMRRYNQWKEIWHFVIVMVINNSEHMGTLLLGMKTFNLLILFWNSDHSMVKHKVLTIWWNSAEFYLLQCALSQTWVLRWGCVVEEIPGSDNNNNNHNNNSTWFIQVVIVNIISTAEVMVL